jgi:hypothetical protein
MSKLLGPEHPHPTTLAVMRSRGVQKGQRWAAYQNHELGHPGLGQLKFLLVGPGATFGEAPERHPDTAGEINWRYVHVGYVDLASGVIVDSPG